MKLFGVVLTSLALVSCGGGGGDPIAATPAASYITWVNSANGQLVVDATGDFVKFRSDNGHMVFGTTEYTNMTVNSTGGALTFNGTVVGGVAYIKSVTGSTIMGLVCSNGTFMDIFGTQNDLTVQCTTVIPIPA